MEIQKHVASDAEIVNPCDMPEIMQREIVQTAKEAASRFDVDKLGATAAEYIKKCLDQNFGAHWHVVIGNGFGSHVVHEKQRFIYFRLNGRSYLIYKAGTGSDPH